MAKPSALLAAIFIAGQAAAHAEVTMYEDRAQFIAAMAPTSLQFPTRLQEPAPGCPNIVTYDTSITFPFGTNSAILTVPFATNLPTCYDPSFAPLLALVPAFYVDNSQDCGFPVDTIIGHGEDDYSLDFATPVYGIGFELWANQIGREALTLTDSNGEVLASISLAPLTTPCQGRFFGFTSTTPIMRAYLDTDGGVFSNEGFGEILVSESLPPAGPPLPCQPRLHGPAHWWPGDGTPQDLIAGVNGTIVGSGLYDAGHVGQAFKFDGTGDYVDLGGAQGVDLDGDSTIEMWIKLDSFTVSSPQSYLFADFDATGNRARMSLRTGSQTLGYYHAHDDGTALSFNGPPRLQLDTWTHVAAVKDDSQKMIRLFVDGQAYASASYPGKSVIPASMAGLVTIGRAGSYAGDYVAGSLDEVTVYHRALSECELKALYLAGRAGFCKGDRDGDSVRDYFDNCMDVYNPQESDEDGDGVGDACDCAPADPTAFASPTDLGRVEYGAGNNRDAIDWCVDALQLESTATFDVLRGDCRELPVGSGSMEACLLSAAPVTNINDAQVPAVSRAFYYLVRSRNICGVGTYGVTSSGALRLSTTCP